MKGGRAEDETYLIETAGVTFVRERWEINCVREVS